MCPRKGAMPQAVGRLEYGCHERKVQIMRASIRSKKSLRRIDTVVLLAFILATMASCNPVPPGGVQPGGDQALPGEQIPGVSESSQQGSPIPGPLKPVGFVNHGTVAATVQVWTYIPLRSDMPSVASNASTVSFPPTAPGLWPNSSRFLSLPLGTYTWCYSWELGDVNNDGMMDYAHAIDTRPVVLDETDSDDMDQAEQVDMSAPPGSGELPGLCGQSGMPDIEWGNEGSSWEVDIQDGIVVGGRAQGDLVWTATGGTFDGTLLYVVWETTKRSDCSARLEQWWRVEVTTVTHLRSLTGCGTERTDQFAIPRKR